MGGGRQFLPDKSPVGSWNHQGNKTTISESIHGRGTRNVPWFLPPRIFHLSAAPVTGWTQLDLSWHGNLGQWPLRIRSLVLIFHTCVTDYHKARGFKQHIYHSILSLGIGRVGLLLMGSHVEIMVLARAVVLYEALVLFHACSGCWQK